MKRVAWILFVQVRVRTNLSDPTLTLVSDPTGIVRERLTECLAEPMRWLPKLRDPHTTESGCDHSKFIVVGCRYRGMWCGLGFDFYSGFLILVASLGSAKVVFSPNFKAQILRKISRDALR